MARWFTSDLHIGHANIIRYCNRPFADVEAMNRGLVDAWNDTVADGDDVWVLGDMAMGRLDDSLALVSTLHGRKVLVAGNHDRCWAGHHKRVASMTGRYLAAGFAEVQQGWLPLRLDGLDHDVLVCHFPYEGDSHDEDRFESQRPPDNGEWLLHGHVHEQWRQRGRMINVGVDVWDMRPVAEATLVELIAAGPADRQG